MGIRGLTTFIQNRSSMYMENYELHDTNLVLDGNSIAYQLYSWHCKSNDCFGGDYDKFANVVYTFFKLLKDCNITPYVVLDGGYEKRKIKTVIERMKNKIQSAQSLNSVTEGSISIYPVFLREIFKDIVLELKVKTVQCDYEGDSETACIARLLNCPVLSYDSDYYIFDVLYIPFNTVDLKPRKNQKQQYRFLSCEIFRVERFLKCYQGLTKETLQIFAVLLGNDYVKRSFFSPFYRQLKIQKSRKSVNEGQKRIKSLVVWLQNETFQSAVSTVLSRFPNKRRPLAKRKIKKAVHGYNLRTTIYLKYLGLENLAAESSDSSADILDNIEIVENNDQSNSEAEEDELDETELNEDDAELQLATELADNNSDIEDICEESSSESEEELDEPDIIEPQPGFIRISQEFYERFRACQYPSGFMDILVNQRYYGAPQVDDHTEITSHAVSFPILTAITKILTNSNSKRLTCVARKANGLIKNYLLPVCELELPSFDEIQTMDVSLRRVFVLKILQTESSFMKVLDLFPPSWHLFIIAINYLSNLNVCDKPHMCALILNCLFSKYVDKKIGGFYRLSNSFNSKFNKKIELIKKSIEKIPIIEKDLYVSHALDKITYCDALLALNEVIPFFQMETKMKNNVKWYNRSIVNTSAQIQSCLLHVKYLNALLNFPFENFLVSDFFDGTFLYNMSTNLRKRSDIEGYIRVLLRNSPSLIAAFESILGGLQETMNNFKNSENVKRKRRKRKLGKESEDIEENKDVFIEQDDSFYDENNKFALLSINI